MPASATCVLSKGSEPSVLIEDAVALQVDDLAGLVLGEGHRVVVGRIGVGADEAVLLAHAVDLSRNRARGLILAVIGKRRGDDDIALVFHRRGGFAGFRRALA